MLTVISCLTAHPGKRKDLLVLFRENMPNVLSEPGCVSYQPYMDAPDLGPLQTEVGEDTVMVLETWATADDLKAHPKAPHMVEFHKKAEPLMASLKHEVFVLA